MPARVRVHARQAGTRAGPCTAKSTHSPGLPAPTQPWGSFPEPQQHPPSSMGDEAIVLLLPGAARAREHASTYYCKPSYCTAVLPPALPRRPGPRWEGACRSACGSAGRPRSPWCSRPKPTRSSNHLGKIQKSPVSLRESCRVPAAKTQN